MKQHLGYENPEDVIQEGAAQKNRPHLTNYEHINNWHQGTSLHGKHEPRSRNNYLKIRYPHNLDHSNNQCDTLKAQKMMLINRE
jgi:hypothetical protein